jgi:hypothetical protein
MLAEGRGWNNADIWGTEVQKLEQRQRKLKMFWM